MKFAFLFDVSVDVLQDSVYRRNFCIDLGGIKRLHNCSFVGQICRRSINVYMLKAIELDANVFAIELRFISIFTFFASIC